MTEIEEKLLALAAESANLEPGDVLSMLAAPDWQTNRSWHWESYIHDGLRDAWPSLDKQARLAAFIQAAQAVGVARER
jgi:hypothetical protein